MGHPMLGPVAWDWSPQRQVEAHLVVQGSKLSTHRDCKPEELDFRAK